MSLAFMFNYQPVNGSCAIVNGFQLVLAATVTVDEREGCCIDSSTRGEDLKIRNRPG